MKTKKRSRGQTTMIRQGDVLVRRVDKVTPDAKTIAKEGGACVLAHGEATGHAHRVLERGAEMFGGGGGGVFLAIPDGGAKLVHEEHSAIALTPGKYEVVRQREYDDAEELRQVAD